MTTAKAAGSTIINSIIAELEQEGKTTRRVLERVPEGKLGWRPHPKSFTLGQLALHVAQTPGAIASIAVQDSIEVPKFQQEQAKSSAHLLQTLDQSLITAKEKLSTLDDSKLTDQWTLNREGKEVFSLPRAAVLR